MGVFVCARMLVIQFVHFKLIFNVHCLFEYFDVIFLFFTVAYVMVYVISLDCHMMSSLCVKAKEQANCIFHMP